LLTVNTIQNNTTDIHTRKHTLLKMIPDLHIHTQTDTTENNTKHTHTPTNRHNWKQHHSPTHWQTDNTENNTTPTHTTTNRHYWKQHHTHTHTHPQTHCAVSSPRPKLNFVHFIF